MRESSTLDGTNEAAAGLHALRTAAAWMPLRDTGWIAVTGDDRVRWLNGMVTNSVQALTTGQGAYTFLLSAQGRIQGDAVVWAEADRLLLQTDRSQVQPLLDLLDRFIIMDDVELAAIERHGIALAGPAAAAVLDGFDLAAPQLELHARTLRWQDQAATVLHAYSPVVPRYEVWFDQQLGADQMTAVLASEAEAPTTSFDLLRILEQRPRFAAADGAGDLRDRDLPQETAQVRALHFAKGCYLGQEIVERIRSRGQVHRTFTGFVLHGEPPAPGTELLADGKTVGLLTTIASQDIDGERLALGFVRREAMERGTPLHYDGGVAEPRGPSRAS